MFKLFKRSTSKRPGILTGHETVSDDAWRPKRGVPALSVDALYDRYRDYINLILSRVALDQEREARYLTPLIRNYLSYAHLLPASRDSHHNEEGGLLVHGLQMAAMAVQSADGQYFLVPGQPPGERKQMEVRWRVALVAGALLHDIGKPMVDLTVVADGIPDPWNILNESLTDWCQRHSITHYRYSWNTGRFRRHEASGLLLVNRLCDKKLEAWLGPHCLTAIMDYLSKHQHSPLYAILSRADNDSATQSLKAGSHTTVQSGYSQVSLGERLNAAMKTAIEENRWRINQPGAQVYVADNRAWLVWPECSHEIIRYLAASNVTGVDYTPRSILSLLLATGHAAQHDGMGAEGIWTIRPHGVNTPDGLGAICVAADTLFSTPPQNYPINISDAPATDVVTEKPPETLPTASNSTTKETAAASRQAITDKASTKSEPVSDSKNEYSAKAEGNSVTNSVPATVNMPFTPDSSRDWLEQVGGRIGVHLGMLSRHINSGISTWGDKLHLENDRLYLVIPAGLPQDMSERDVQEALDRCVWIDRSGGGFGLNCTLAGGRRGIPLADEVKTRVISAAGGAPKIHTEQSRSQVETEAAPTAQKDLNDSFMQFLTADTLHEPECSANLVKVPLTTVTLFSARNQLGNVVVLKKLEEAGWQKQKNMLILGREAWDAWLEKSNN